MATAKKNGLVNIQDISNDAEELIHISIPYAVDFTLQGSSDILFHRWSNEAVKEKSAAAKNSKTKKTDNLESYVYRTDKGTLALPGEYVRGSIIHAAKFRQDPRSSRKSAMDLYKASIIPLTILGDLGVKDWAFEDQRRVLIQRAAITRTRPGLRSGWEASFRFQVLTPEYISAQDLYSVLCQAGILVGVGDFRPTFGRFNVTSFKVVDLAA